MGVSIEPKPLDDAFRSAMRRVASTVTIVTAFDEGRHHGMTATSVTSVSMQPPSLIVCLNQKTLLHHIVLRARRFCVNILSRDQAFLSQAFSGAVPAERRFAEGDWQFSADGLGYLRDAQAYMFCRRKAAVPYGTHTLFIGDVEEVGVGDATTPLVYHDAAYCVAAPAA